MFKVRQHRSGRVPRIITEVSFILDLPLFSHEEPSVMFNS